MITLEKALITLSVRIIKKINEFKQEKDNNIGKYANRNEL